MNLRRTCGVLTLLGALLLLWFFAGVLLESGWDVPRFFHALLANHVSACFAMDVLVSALVLVVFVVAESRRQHRPGTIWCLLGLCAGVSFAFPLFLYVRERVAGSGHAGV